MAAERAALLVIDTISSFGFPEAARLRRGILAAQRTHALRTAFHAHQRPVIYANDNVAEWRTDFAGLVALAARSCDLGRSVAARLNPTGEDYFILKPKHSAFLATALPVRLAKLGVDTLYPTGMTAESCVLATALDANAREHRGRVVAVAGLAGVRAHALATMRQARIAEIIGSTTACTRLRAS